MLVSIVAPRDEVCGWNYAFVPVARTLIIATGQHLKQTGQGGKIMDNKLVKVVVIVLAVIGFIAVLGFLGMGTMMTWVMGS